MKNCSWSFISIQGMLLLDVLSQILTKTTDILARLIILISQYVDTHINLLFMHHVNGGERERTIGIFKKQIEVCF